MWGCPWMRNRAMQSVCRTPIREPTDTLRDQVPIDFGPLLVTPYLADHSGFDSYSLRVEADGRSLIYTGDLRSHGRKPWAFQRLLSAPHPVNALLLEGTHVRDEEAPEPMLSEVDVETAALNCSAGPAGWCSPATHRRTSTGS